MKVSVSRDIRISDVSDHVQWRDQRVVRAGCVRNIVVGIGGRYGRIQRINRNRIIIHTSDRIGHGCCIHATFTVAQLIGDSGRRLSPTARYVEVAIGIESQIAIGINGEETTIAAGSRHAHIGCTAT